MLYSEVKRDREEERGREGRKEVMNNGKRRGEGEEHEFSLSLPLVTSFPSPFLLVSPCSISCSQDPLSPHPHLHPKPTSSHYPSPFPFSLAIDPFFSNSLSFLLTFTPPLFFPRRNLKYSSPSNPHPSLSRHLNPLRLFTPYSFPPYPFLLLLLPPSLSPPPLPPFPL